MFCPNCGEQLETPNQSFCAQCGSKIDITLTPEISQEPQVPVVETPTSPPVPSVSVYDTKPIKSQGTGPYSRKALAFALIWPIFFIIAFYIGFIFTIFRRFTYSPYMPRNPSLWVIPLVLHVIALIFSIVSRANSSKARKFEGENGLQKAGSILSVFGIVLNVIFLVIVPIMMGTAFILPYYNPF
ncbi:MAG: zinc-ribbon domain-containing protein [Promethearchaeota archaeon]|jgi:hypothetical protein